VRRRTGLVIKEVVMTYVLYIWASTFGECGLRRGMQEALLSIAEIRSGILDSVAPESWYIERAWLCLPRCIYIHERCAVIEDNSILGHPICIVPRLFPLLSPSIDTPLTFPKTTHTP
jgi:hypothetical protein